MDLDKFEQKIGISFQNKDLLKQAFTHRSFINESRGTQIGHNERLEFLGDAVLELIVTAFLYEKYPKKDEGAMTSYRSGLVNAVTLSEVATELDMNSYLLLSRGEAKDEGRARQFILANTFEAFVGALYLDQGYEATHKFITTYLFPRADEIVREGKWIDAKSLFQEQAQEIAGVTPVYKTVKEEGPDHDRHFTVGVFLLNEKVAEGIGRSKQDAEQEAAKRALETKKWG